MNKYFYLIIITFSLLISFENVMAQNLVLNPSFENTTGTCTGFAAGESYSQVVDWNNANSNTPGDSCSSPDLFSPCNILPIIGGPSPTFAPNNMLGTQCAKSGTKYAGIITNEMGAIGSNYREYIQGKLSSPLQAGKTYCISFYVSLGDNVNYATNNLGVYFSNSQYMRDACAQGSLINVTPQLNYNCSPILDTANWKLLSWNYVATGGESYFMIGNFFTNATTQIVGTGISSLNPYAYYYIDDVSVQLGACDFAEIMMPNSNSCSNINNNPSDPFATFCITDPALNLVAQTGVNCTNPPVTGTWAGPGITSSTNGTFDPSVAGIGTHTITYTTQYGYIATVNIVVSNCSAIVVCKEANGDLTASGGTTPFSWQKQTTTQDCSACLFGCAIPPNCAVNVTSWTNFATGTTIPAPTVYPIRVKDGANVTLDIASAASLPACNTTACPTITVTSSNQSNVKCKGGNNGGATVAATGGATPYTYSWSPGSIAGATQNSLSAGTYTVTATDVNLCTGTVTVTITEPTVALAVSSSKTDASCGNNNGTASASASGGTTPYTYSWSNGAVTQNITTLAAGSYTVTVTDKNSCTATSTVIVANSSGLTATATVIHDEDCGQQNGELNAGASGGTTPYTYSWSNGAGTQNITNLAAGSYTVTVTDKNSCTATATVIVANSSGLTATATVIHDEDCGQQNGELNAGASGGTTPYTYSWSNGAGTQNITNLAAGSYTVTVTDKNSCTVTATATIANQAGFTVSSQLTQPTCQNPTGSIALTPNGGATPFSYQWSNGGATASISNLTPGIYSVQITDDNNCVLTESYTITANTNQPTISISGNNSICSGQTAILTASGGTTYSWSTGENNNPINVSPASTTTYTVTGTDGNGCSGTATITVTVLPTIIAAFTPSPDSGGAPLEVTFTNSSSNATNYSWNFGNGQTSNSSSSTVTNVYDVPGEYDVLLVADNGFCKDTAYAKIIVNIFPEIQIHIPNVFTPNGDNINDGFYIETQYAKTVHVEIYNRWGNQMAVLEKITDYWDGFKASDGVYFYKYRITDLNDKVYEGQGFFHLFRKK